MPEIAVIIPHYNDVARLLRCLDALAPQLADGGAEIEVAVIDNGSTEPLDAVRAAVAALPGGRLISEEVPGAAEARNRGVAETSAPLLAFLDCDCVPAGDWIATLRRFGRGAGAAAAPEILGGSIVVFDETPPPRSGAEAFETVFAFDNRRYVEKQGFSVTANLFTRRDIFTRVGPLRSGVSEDLEWCRRAVDAGFRLGYAEELRVSHPTRADWAALRRKWRRTTIEGFGTQSGTAAARLRWALRGLAMLPSIVAHAPRVMGHPELSSGEKLRAITTLARLRIRRCSWMLWQAAGGRI